MVESIFNIEDDRWIPYIEDLDLDTIFFNVFDVLSYKIPKDKVLEVSFTFTNDIEIQEINKEYRNINKATNVLSFPIYEKEFLSELDKNNYLPIGDIVLSFDRIYDESKFVGFYEHFIHLIIHSILHLLGYDHLDEDDSNEMENLEIKILERMNIKNPYIS